MAARRLRPYFEAHPIAVITDKPLRSVLSKPDLSGRLVRWSVELSEFDISYVPRSAIKGQALADFLVEFDGLDDVGAEQIGEGVSGEQWTVNTDGSATAGKSGAGVVLVSPDGFTLKSAIQFDFKATNNEAEYEAVLAGLRMAEVVHAKRVLVRCDSQLVVNQVLGSFEAKGESMIAYLAEVKKRMLTFEGVEWVYVPREENVAADSLAKMASFAEPGVFLEILKHRSIAARQVVSSVVSAAPTWVDEMKAALEGRFPGDPVQARRLKHRMARFYFSPEENCLFRRGFSAPSQRCLAPEQVEPLMKELHSGYCGDHAGGRTLMTRILRLGYYWPSIDRDTLDYVRRCDRCQRYANAINSHADGLKSIEATWPFSRWGIDLVGPLPKAPGGFKFLVVAVDYFTKWVEASPLVHITADNLSKFVWKNIICRFGVPHSLVADNGKQFNCREFVDYMARLGTKVCFASVAYPQCNGQVEAVNKTIIRNLEKRLLETTKAKHTWPDQVPDVLWAQRTKPNESTGETPFSLALGSEAVLPIELDCLTARIARYDEELNHEQRRLDLDLLDERRRAASLRNAVYRQKMTKHYNAKVTPRIFKVGELVLKRTIQNMKVAGQGKLGAPWQGPYTVARVGKNGAYDLLDPDGYRLERPWNAYHLKKYYA